MFSELNSGPGPLFNLSGSRDDEAKRPLELTPEDSFVEVNWTCGKRVMYVLCTLAVLTLHSLFKNRNKTVEPSGTSETAGQKGQPEDGGVVEVWGIRGDESVRIVDRRGLMSCRGEGKRRRGGRGVRNVPDSRKRVQVRRQTSRSDRTISST